MLMMMMTMTTSIIGMYPTHTYTFSRRASSCRFFVALETDPRFGSYVELRSWRFSASQFSNPKSFCDSTKTGAFSLGIAWWFGDGYTIKKHQTPLVEHPVPLQKWLFVSPRLTGPQMDNINALGQTGVVLFGVVMSPWFKLTCLCLKMEYIPQTVNFVGNNDDQFQLT
jgi:hypothetical protein